MVGVAGNHDTFGDYSPNVAPFSDQPNIHLLDGQVVNLGGMAFAGISGIVGDPSKPQRRTEKDFVSAIKNVLATKPDVLLLHEGPDVPNSKLPGNESIRKAITQSKNQSDLPLTMCGHVHWPVPFAELDSGLQVLNVDNYGLLLTKA